MTTKHNHGPNFGRIIASCPRCMELRAGAPAITWVRDDRRREDARRVREIREHFSSHKHTSGGCGPCCTFGDY